LAPVLNITVAGLVAYLYWVLVISSAYSWNSEGVALVLLWRKIKEIVRIQISTEPYKNNGGKCNKAHTVVD